MKKRLSKLALLAVAAAVVLAGFPACGDDEDEDPPLPATATIAGEDIPEDGLALTAGTPQDVTATVTLTNGTFSDEAKSLNKGDPIPEGYLTLEAGEGITIEGVKVAATATDTDMEITFTVTAADGAEAGEITATLEPGTVKNYAAAITATGAISYTVAATQPDPTKTIESIAVKTPPTKTAYTVGDTLAPAGLVITATYDDGSTTSIGYSEANKDNFKFEGFDATAASASVTVTVTYKEKTATFTVSVEEPVYFKSFVASEDLGKTADSGSYETLTSKDGLVTMGRTKYQVATNPPSFTTIDYDEGTGSGHTYTARAKVNKTNNDGEGKLTIKSVKVGAILRIDGGNANTDVRKMNITGADETVWEATKWDDTKIGSFYLTATAETVVLESMDNEFCIYGIYVVDEKVAETVVKEETTYAAPTITLSETSVEVGGDVTISATTPPATKKTVYSTSRVTSESVPVTAEIAYSGATVENGKVSTTTEETLSIIASYTVGEETYKSEAVTLEVMGSFTTQTAEVVNNEETLGLVATGTPTSDNENVATAEVKDNNIVITSKAKGKATITVSDGTKSAKIDVTVKANGTIVTDVHKYVSSVIVEYVTVEKQFNNTAIVSGGGDGKHHKEGLSVKYNNVTYTTGYKMESGSEITLTLSAAADIYFVANGNKTLKIDSKNSWEVNKLIENVAAGTYKLTNGSGSNQTSVCAVVITYK